ncbi:MAG: hypothetical protein WCJ33_10260, partial [Pseudomonadota bacterium]
KKMIGSYQDCPLKPIVRIMNHIKWEADRAKLEIGADAAAADYQYCSECLGVVAGFAGEHEPQETFFGYITTPKGYFSKQDYLLYQTRAKEACALCPAHSKWISFEQSKPSLKDFLPTIIK